MCSCRVLPHTCTTNSCGGIWSCIEKTDKQILYNQGTIAEVKKHVHYSQHVYRPCYLSWMWMLRSSTSYTEWVGLLLQYNLLLYRLAVYRGSDFWWHPTYLSGHIFMVSISYLACWILWWHGWKHAWSEVVVMMVMAEATTIDHHHHNHEYVQLYFLMPLCLGRWYKTVNGESLNFSSTDFATFTLHRQQ